MITYISFHALRSVVKDKLLKDAKIISKQISNDYIM